MDYYGILARGTGIILLYRDHHVAGPETAQSRRLVDEFERTGVLDTLAVPRAAIDMRDAPEDLRHAIESVPSTASFPLALFYQGRMVNHVLSASGLGAMPKGLQSELVRRMRTDLGVELKEPARARVIPLAAHQ